MQNAGANFAELPLYHMAILPNPVYVFLIALALLLLLYAGDNAPRSTPSANDVLVGHREQVALLNRQLLIMNKLRNLLHLLHHLVITLRLLGKLCHVDAFLPIDRHS
ncbi:hypothetical protein Vafri_2740 [Volvox africanus]|uniref:Uncharacterized protein n=1 Tax=Volvox africanus TaxID=51714 RepID=A0A8J4EVN2_9CHLO|nr:hypothetical protein Vafri_2740 [Volvox africanus]